MERGDMVNATYLRWERCVTYLGEFMRLTMNVDDIPVRDVTAGIIDDLIQKMLGHSDIKTTQIYARIQDQTVA